MEIYFLCNKSPEEDGFQGGLLQWLSRMIMDPGSFHLPASFRSPHDQKTVTSSPPQIPVTRGLCLSIKTKMLGNSLSPKTFTGEKNETSMIGLDQVGWPGLRMETGDQTGLAGCQG
jgi:hypothetical protein